MSIIKDLNSWYISGAQASIYIGNYLLDDALEVNAQFSSGATPIYSAFDHLYKAVIPGQGLASGVIGTAYREEGYIEALLEQYRKLDQASNEQNNDRANSESDLSIQSMTNGAIPIGSIVQTGNNSTYDAKQFSTYAEEQRKRYWGVKDITVLPRLYTTKFEIIIYYGNPSDDNVSKEYIFDVIILSRTKQFDNSGKPVGELYNFIGKIMI